MLRIKAAILMTVIMFIATTYSIKSRFKSVKCTPLNTTILKVRYCFIKAYSRNYASINFGTTRTVAATRPYNMILTIHYRYGTIFREILHSEFEWCSIMDGTTENLMAKAVGALLKNSKSGVFDPCPIPIGDSDRVNVTLDDNFWPSPIPSGLYRLALTHGKF